MKFLALKPPSQQEWENGDAIKNRKTIKCIDHILDSFFVKIFQMIDISQATSMKFYAFEFGMLIRLTAILGVPVSIVKEKYKKLLIEGQGVSEKKADLVLLRITFAGWSKDIMRKGGSIPSKMKKIIGVLNKKEIDTYIKAGRDLMEIYLISEDAEDFSKQTLDLLSHYFKLAPESPDF